MNFIRNFFILILCLICLQTVKADWTKLNLNTLAWLKDVYFLNEKDGWIAGSDGTFFKTIDGGKNWTKEKISADDTIRQVYFSDEQNGWLLCERDAYVRGVNSPSYLLRTTNGGVDWKRVEFADDRKSKITKIFFTKNGAGLAVGEGGAVFTTTGDEKSWNRVVSPSRYLMFDGIFTDNLHGAMVGAGSSVFLTDDAGASWNKATVSGSSDAKLNAVFFINQRNGWTVGTQGKIFQTINSGKFWREQNSGVAKDLTDIFFINTAEGWASGDEGTILHTTTAGNIWATDKSITKHKLEKLFFIGKKGWAVGFGGTILLYDEAGAKTNASSGALKYASRKLNFPDADA